MKKGDQLCILRSEVITDADTINLLRLVGALTAIGVALDDDCPYLETRELTESRERRLVTWTLKARSACGEYDTRKLIDAWHDPAWTRENPEHPFAYIKTAFQNAALLAAQVLGSDLAYMGTKFIATHESMAAPEYKQMLVDSGMDDVMLTQAFTGLDTNMLKPSMIRVGLDPQTLPPRVSIEEAARRFSSKGESPIDNVRRYKDIWSAGHSISGVTRIQSAAELVEQTWNEYQTARRNIARTLTS